MPRRVLRRFVSARRWPHRRPLRASAAVHRRESIAARLAGDELSADLDRRSTRALDSRPTLVAAACAGRDRGRPVGSRRAPGRRLRAESLDADRAADAPVESAASADCRLAWRRRAACASAAAPARARGARRHCGAAAVVTDCLRRCAPRRSPRCADQRRRRRAAPRLRRLRALTLRRRSRSRLASQALRRLRLTRPRGGCGALAARLAALPAVAHGRSLRRCAPAARTARGGLAIIDAACAVLARRRAGDRASASAGPASVGIRSTRRLPEVPHERTSSLSIVVPAYKEEDNVARALPPHARGARPAGVDWEIIFAVDPCTDRTEERILGLRALDPRVKMLRFSRRFGQPAATLAGSEAAGRRGRRHRLRPAGPARADRRHVARWREGYDVVYAPAPHARGRDAAQADRRGARLPRHQARRRRRDPAQHRRLPADVPARGRRGLALDEAHGFLRGLVALVGFRQTAVLYDRDPRAAGDGKYNRFLGSLRDRAQRDRRLLALPAARHLRSGGSPSLRVAARRWSTSCLRLAGVEFPTGNPTLVIMISLLQRHPAAQPRGHGRVRRAHLRRGQAAPEVHRRALDGFERPMAELEATERRRASAPRLTRERSRRSASWPAASARGWAAAAGLPKPLVAVAGGRSWSTQLELPARHGASRAS